MYAYILIGHVFDIVLVLVMNLKASMYLIVAVSSFIMLMAPCISAVNSHVGSIQEEKTSSVNLVQKDSFLKDARDADPLLNMIKILLRIYTTGFMLTFFLSLFVTIPIAIWITYFGSIFEIFLTAFGLSFMTAFKWPVLLFDIFLRILQGGQILDHMVLHSLQSIK